MLQVKVDIEERRGGGEDDAEPKADFGAAFPQH